MRRVPADAPILTAAAMRAAEAAAIAGGVSAETLMERAGLAVAREVRRFGSGRPVLVLAGRGNNGGDAYVVACLLREWGIDVTVASLGDPATELCRVMADRWTGTTTLLPDAGGRPILVDGLLGTGAVRPFDPAARARLIDLHQGADLVLSIDLPSGMAADADGDDHSIAPATITIALGALKPAHVISYRCGHVLLADLGLEVGSRTRTLAVPSLEPLPYNTNKFARGMVLVVGGAMVGASELATASALHGGVGYVVLAGGKDPTATPHAIVRRQVGHAGDLAALLDDKRIGAVVIGPGLGRDDRAKALLDAALASDRDLVIDGDALTLLGRDVSQRIGADRRRVILTPHSGEFDRLFGDGGGSKLDRTRAAAAASGATVVHKGADTVIAHPSGEIRMACGATAWLSTAGSGDVLAGLVASRHALGSVAAAEEAVWLHSRAGALAGQAFSADDLVCLLPSALAQAEWR